MTNKTMTNKTMTEKKMTGFRIFAGGVDIFIESEKMRKTVRLAKEIIWKLNGTGRFDIPDNLGLCLPVRSFLFLDDPAVSAARNNLCESLYRSLCVLLRKISLCSHSCY